MSHFFTKKQGLFEAILSPVRSLAEWLRMMTGSLHRLETAQAHILQGMEAALQPLQGNLSRLLHNQEVMMEALRQRRTSS